MEKNLILLRGLPGSGKSTLAKVLVGDKDYCHKEAVVMVTIILTLQK